MSNVFVFYFPKSVSFSALQSYAPNVAVYQFIPEI
jgi:hypothetical protein